MTIIPSPKRPENYADRIADCDNALDGAVRAIFEAALAAGWSSNEIAHSIRMLAYRCLQVVPNNKELNPQAGQ
ncbi:hypothetical protein [Methylovirgula sp. 4M-Z18]|uniref:hypothetical protein n=1 Tax=Methylovirgula sp. 4M-Z18 TaxID=2293567 RepID=UPI000E2FE484|nr:hypothetical protein [Methylovirgula sp. 4M-Z18]RFB76626.1 hypothetical protein DYH55_19360 [Methylovirgula sp. 4M-Z18]